MKAVAAVASIVVGLMYIAFFVLAPSDNPVLAEDSTGYLAVGRWIAGVGEVPQQLGNYYTFGYGILLALPYLFTDDIRTVYGVAIAFNAVAGAALVFPLRALCVECIGQSPVAATVVAVGAAIQGAVALQVGEVWPEVLLALGVTWWALLLFRLTQCPFGGVAMALGFCSLVLFVLHHRTLPLAAVTLLVLLNVGVRERHARPLALCGVALLLGGMLLAVEMDGLVRNSLYPVGAVETAIMRVDWTGSAREVVTVILGEAWYAAVATFGMAGAGLLVLVVRRPPLISAFGVVAFLTALGGVALLGALQLGLTWQHESFRVDFLAYGRYVAPFLPTIVGVAAGSLLSAPTRRLATLATPASIVATTVLMLATNAHALAEGGLQKVNVTGILGAQAIFDAPSPTGSKLFLVGVAVVMLIGSLLIVAAAQTRRAFVGGAVAAALFGVSAAIGAVEEMRPYHDFWHDRYTDLPAVVHKHAPHGPVAFVLSSPPQDAFMRLQMFEPDSDVVLWSRSSQEPPATDFLIGPSDWQNRPAWAHLVATTETSDVSLYAVRDSSGDGASR